MMHILLVGLAAGAASALLFASVTSGSLLSIGLFYLAPLPIMIAAVGWSHWSALVAAVAAAAGLSAIFGGIFFVAFLTGIGLPAWWLGYLALLARPNAAGGDLEWYPPGRLVVWAALVAALVVVAAIVNLGLDEATYRTNLQQTFERILRAQYGIPRDRPLEIPGVEAQRVVDVLIAVVPPGAAALATATNVINLWLAGKAVKISGRLRRPWPDLPQMRFPAYAPALLAAAIAGSFLNNLMGTVAGVVAAALLMAYAVLGFAVLHALTRGRAARGLVLGSSYAAVLVLGWPVLLVTLIGLADTAFDLRTRLAARGGTPSQ
jgi:hypothetical protein